MKSPTHLDKCIVCPKCGTKTMRKALGKNPVAEYFDDKCHQYFTIEELVHIWGYDAGDLIHSVRVIGPEEAQKLLDAFADGFHETIKWVGEQKKLSFEDKLVATTWFDGDSVSVIDEPTFKSPSERLEAYQMVDRMFIGIPEWSMESNEVDTGATHV